MSAIGSVVWWWGVWGGKIRKGVFWASVDWGMRFPRIAFFAGGGALSWMIGWPYPAPWLAAKVLLFAGAMVCGIFVRYYIREAYRSALPAIAADRATDADNEEFRILMIKGTWALVVLWVLLFTIGALGALKPG